MADMKSVQFATQHSVSIGADDEVGSNTHQTGAANPMYQGVPDVVPLSSKTMSSVDRTTAWRNHRNGTSLPQPYSKRNAGSIYSFDQ
jgi:hypothetical protein